MSSANISPRVHIGEVIRNAVLLNPGNHQERLMNSDFLIETVARFFALLRERQHDRDHHLNLYSELISQYSEKGNALFIRPPTNTSQVY